MSNRASMCSCVGVETQRGRTRGRLLSKRQAWGTGQRKLLRLVQMHHRRRVKHRVRQRERKIPPRVSPFPLNLSSSSSSAKACTVGPRVGRGARDDRS